MSDLFSGLSGVRFPEVVMNQGPLPGTGGLPAPLHDTPDARINYNSSLLGDISPYAYGEPGYLSSQNAYLNIPHRIQKFIPPVYLPEPNGLGTFEISHGVDDGDIAFVMRLSRESIFCTGTKMGVYKRGGATAVDPFINLPTLNYILAGLQINLAGQGDLPKNLWSNLLHDMDRRKWHAGRNYEIKVQNKDGLELPDEGTDPFTLDDIIHFLRHCVKPFGVCRGSEKQGGQSETTLSSVQWPVGAMLTMVLDGKEGNVVNIWHKHAFNAGDDLVLRLKPMPLQPYVLNHYYKSVVRKTFTGEHYANKYVWQLVPDVYSLDYGEGYHEYMANALNNLYANGAMSLLKQRGVPRVKNDAPASASRWTYVWHGHGDKDPEGYALIPWQELGFWHIGRTQIMMNAYGIEEFYCNDLANNLKTNHLDITFQPVYVRHPYVELTVDGSRVSSRTFHSVGEDAGGRKRAGGALADDRGKRGVQWSPELALERLLGECQERPAEDIRALQAFLESLARPTIELAAEPPAPPEAAAQPEAPGAKAKPRRTRPVEGSLLRADGSTEPSGVTLLGNSSTV